MVTRQGKPWLERFGGTNELRWVWRGLRARGARAVLIIGLLAVAFSASTLLFSMTDSLVFRSLPYRDPDRLVTFGSDRGPSWSVGPGVLDAGRSQTQLFAGLHGYFGQRYTFVPVANQQTMVHTAFVTPGLIEMLGGSVKWGRTLAEQDALETSTRVALIAESLARSRFGDPALAVGQPLNSPDDLVVIGVVPSTFSFPDARHRVWRPLDYQQMARFNLTASAVARLAPGANVSDVTQWARSLAPNPGAPPGAKPYATLLSGAYGATAEQRLLMLVLLAASLCLLLTAAANAAGLELTGAIGRARTHAIQLALGASRASLLVTAAIESAFLVGASILTAAGLAVLGTSAIQTWLPVWMSRQSTNIVDVDGRAYGFMAAVAAVTWLAATLPVALVALRTNLLALLRQDDRTTATSRGGTRARNWLTIAQMALAVTLLLGGVLYARTYLALLGIDKGFDSRRIAQITLTIPAGTPGSATRAAMDALVAGLEARPDVKGVTRLYGSEFDVGNTTNAALEQEGSATSRAMRLSMRQVDPKFFTTFQVPLRRGRVFDLGDPPDAVVVGERFARQVWPDQDPIGHRFRSGPSQPWLTVVGVAGHTRNISDRPTVADAAMEHFAVFSQARAIPPRPAPANVAAPAPPQPNVPRGALFQSVAFAARLDATVRLSDIAKIAQAINPVFQVRVESIDDRYAAPFLDRLLAARVVGGFAILAFLVSMAGLYGVMALLVATRTREIGVRIALGAGQRDIRRLILTSAGRLVSAGVIIGAGAALVASRWTATQLFGVSATDPLTYALVAMAVSVTAILASWQPARQAARVDPAVTLRAD